ncbi:MAG TPA: glycoside hydrolase family 95 protein [Prolixibacteraceae bacterium]|nr:glycoside hydrolase family 95 protein [Prolixibacteraceae bacterium]
MKKILITVLLVSSLLFPLFAQGGDPLKIWYDKPATVWNEALPIGNGRLGAMVYGDPVQEKIQLNEETFWSGGPSRNDNPNAVQALPEIRRLIFEGKYREAETKINENMMTPLNGSMYQVAGTLDLMFPGHEDYTAYSRELDLSRAIFQTSYTVGGVHYRREVFASMTDQVIVVRLSADQPGKITFIAGISSPLQTSVQANNAQTLEMNALSGSHEGVSGQVRLNAQTRILYNGGSSSVESDKIRVDGADEATLFISLATNFVDYQTLTANETEKCAQYLETAQNKSWDALFDHHVRAWQRYFNRVRFDLGTSEAANQPTDVRIKNFSQTYDPELITLYFQFGRYLLISSSQPGGQPANLQGIWNESTRPAWDSKYTININTEMNYWPAEKCNLTELHEPLIRMVNELSQTGQKTARDMYGCDGWVVHHNTDIWRISGVVDGAFWGMWPMGGAWLTQHL